MFWCVDEGVYVLVIFRCLTCMSSACKVRFFGGAAHVCSVSCMCVAFSFPLFVGPFIVPLFDGLSIVPLFDGLFAFSLLFGPFSN